MCWLVFLYTRAQIRGLKIQGMIIHFCHSLQKHTKSALIFESAALILEFVQQVRPFSQLLRSSDPRQSEDAINASQRPKIAKIGELKTKIRH